MVKKEGKRKVEMKLVHDALHDFYIPDKIYLVDKPKLMPKILKVGRLVGGNSVKTHI